MNVRENEVHLTSNYSPQLLKKLYAQYVFDNHNTLQRFSEGPLCLCNISAAVIAEILLKKVTHMCQVSDCHPKGRKARVWKKKGFAWHFLTLQDGQSSVEWQSVSHWVSADISRNQGSRLESQFWKVSTLPTCPWARHPQCPWILMHNTHLSTKGCEIGTTS